jgi:hypothetical protein
LVALMPESNLALTTKAYPTFWFSLPTISTSRTLEFRLFNQDNELLYVKSFQADGESGVVSLALPEDGTLPALTMNDNYRWHLSIVCDPAMRAQDVYVSGWVRRVAIEEALAARLQEAEGLSRARLYLDAGLWSEALSALTVLRQTHPEDVAVAAQWSELLESVGLAQVSAEPLRGQSPLTTQISQRAVQ